MKIGCQGKREEPRPSLIVGLVLQTPKEEEEEANHYTIFFVFQKEMERATISPSLSQNYLLCPSPRALTTRLHSFSTTRNLSPSSCSSSIKVYLSLFVFLLHCYINFSNCYNLLTHFLLRLYIYSQLQHSSSNGGTSLTRCNAVLSNSSSRFVVFKIILGYPYLNLMIRLWGFITLLNLVRRQQTQIGTTQGSVLSRLITCTS